MKIAFVKPSLETDATWDPVRTCPYLGIWYMASKLKRLGHEVWYLDEVVRNNGLANRELFYRSLSGASLTERPMVTTAADYQRQKMADFREIDPTAFVRRYSAHRTQGTIERVMTRVGNPTAETMATLQALAPDIVAIPLIASANYLPVVRLARTVKEHFPTVRVIVGGQHVSATAQEFLRDNPWVDHVVIGDGIAVIEDLLKGRTPGSLVHGGFREMSEYPLLDYEIIADAGYPLLPTHTFPTGTRKSVDFMFGRGCFRRCDFCVAGCTKTFVTTTAYDRLEHQLAHFKAHGIEELVVQDDAFLWDKRHVTGHLPAILKIMKSLGMSWQNNGGVDFEGLTDWVTDRIIEYNTHGQGRCTSLYVPFNPRGWNKNCSATSSMTSRYHGNMENLRRLRAAGIYVFTSSIIGTPEQTLASFKEELDADRSLIANGYLDAALPLSATMLPGTNWFKTNGHNIINQLDYPGYSLFTTHHRTAQLEPQDIERMMISWLRGLKDVQRVNDWQSAFPG